jgi:hypothetical protein
MKTRLTLPSGLLMAAAFAALSTADLAAQDPAASPTPAVASPTAAAPNRSVFSPSARQPKVLPEGQRNPFGAAAAPAEEEQEMVAAETEEAKLRRILGKMRVTGLSGSPGSYSVVVGSMVLREGEKLPRLYANQAEELRVDSVTTNEVILTFTERVSGIPPRSMILRFDLSPQVRSVLPGELFQAMVPVDPKGNIQLADVEPPAAKEIEKGLKAQEFEGLVERRFKLMGSPLFPPGDEDKQPQQP